MTQTLEALDNNLLVAMQVARQHHVAWWHEQLDVHRRHAGFQTCQDAVTRRIGFSCACTGDRQEYMIDLTSFVSMLPEARASVSRLLATHSRNGQKERKRKQRQADKRSEALLFKYLTRAQKWCLRAEEYFDIVGQDGHHYRIKYGMGGNVQKLDPVTREPVTQYCVVPKMGSTIPTNDLFLESDVAAFMKLAVVRDLREPDTYIPADGGEPVPPTWLDDNGPVRTPIEIGDLLLHDICPNAEALFDQEPGTVGFVLNDQLEVVPTFGVVVRVPRLRPDVAGDHTACIIRMITGVPALRYSSSAEVVQHFHYRDLQLDNLLVHPDMLTRLRGSVYEQTFSQETERLFGAHIFTDDRIPLGKAFCLASNHHVGAAVHWYEGEDRGYIILNLDGVCILELPHEDEEADQARA